MIDATSTSASVLTYEHRSPAGVFALISPWNMPLYLLTWKIAPCLAFGCTAVAKPSEITSITAFRMPPPRRKQKGYKTKLTNPQYSPPSSTNPPSSPPASSTSSSATAPPPAPPWPPPPTSPASPSQAAPQPASPSAKPPPTKSVRPPSSHPNPNTNPHHRKTPLPRTRRQKPPPPLLRRPDPHPRPPLPPFALRLPRRRRRLHQPRRDLPLHVANLRPRILVRRVPRRLLRARPRQVRPRHADDGRAGQSCAL